MSNGNVRVSGDAACGIRHAGGRAWDFSFFVPPLIIGGGGRYACRKPVGFSGKLRNSVLYEYQGV